MSDDNDHTDHGTIVNDYKEAFTNTIERLIDTVDDIKEEEDNDDTRPQRLQMRTWGEGLQWVQNRVITSNKDIRMFNSLYSSADELNQVYINQTEMAKEYGVSKVKINKFIKSMTDIKFLHKKTRGVYTVNPFVVISTKVRNNKGGSMVLQIQKNWKFLVGMPPLSKNLRNGDTLVEEVFNPETRHFEKIADLLG